MRCSSALPLLAKQLREPLEFQEETALGRHLAACADCRAEAVALQALEVTLLRAAAVPTEPLPTVRIDTAAIMRSRPERRATRWLPATAVGLATVGAAWMVRPPSPQPTEPRSVQRVPHPTALVELQQSIAGVPTKAPADVALPPAVQSGRPGISRVEQPVARVARSGAGGHGRVAVIRRMPTEKPAARGPEPSAAPQVPLPALQVQAPEPVAVPGQVLPVVFAPTPEPPEENGPVASALLGDARLAARLPLSEKDAPLGELLPRLGVRLRVRLTAGREVADDKLTLFLRERSAAEALTLAARHLGFKWRRVGEGYELRQDFASRQREQALLRNELQPIETQLNLAARRLAEPAAQKRERVEALDAQLKDESLGADERARLVAEKQTVLDAWLSPARVDASLMLFRSLTPGQIDSLLDGSEFRYSTTNGTLPPLVAVRAHDSTSDLEPIYGPLPRLQADVTLSLSDVEDMDELPPSRRNRRLRLRAQFTTIRGSKADPHYWGGNWAPHVPEPVPVAPGALVTDSDLKQPVELTLPGPDKQPLVFTGGSPICAAQLGALWPRRATVAEVADAIRQATGLEVVADSFVSARLDPSLLRGRRPLAEILQKVADELDYTWEKRGKLLLLRDRRFYCDRPAEVPERLLQPFRTRVLRQGELTLDELSDLAAQLSDTQARGMYRYWGWYLDGTGILPTDYFFSHRHHLRFWAALQPRQRKTLRDGGVLAVTEMLPAQRRLWAEALNAPPVTANTPSAEQRVPTLEERASGSFSLRVTENQAALFVFPSPDGKRQPASGITVEGPTNYDIRKLMSADPNGPQPELAGPPLSLAGYSFSYFVGGDPKPLRNTKIMIAPLQKSAPAKPNAVPIEKE